MTILEWFFAPIDPSRDHSVGVLLSWHARIMVIAWGVITPAAALSARYFKILPWQKWPEELDNPAWWKFHWIGQTGAIALSSVGLLLILLADFTSRSSGLHAILGYMVLALGVFQALSGVLRGSKGGPTALGPDGSLAGDHYDMTPRRLHFEAVHKVLGYIVILIATACIAQGLWIANAPNWMWLSIFGWWMALIAMAVWLQMRFGSYDTYQAIWGPDRDHPGNRMRKQGWGTVRPGDEGRVWERPPLTGGKIE